jgi:predicted type IV restriction endonuclease
MKNTITKEAKNKLIKLLEELEKYEPDKIQNRGVALIKKRSIKEGKMIGLKKAIEVIEEAEREQL